MIRLPRWTAYVALAVLASFLVTAVPMRGGSRDEAAREARARVTRGAARRVETNAEVVRLLDPDED